MVATVTDENTRIVTEALAQGHRLHVAIMLSYVGGGSDKFWSAVWGGDTIVANYGRHGSYGQTKTHSGLTVEQGAAKLWGLLRAKVGAGYTVVDACVTYVPEADQPHPRKDSIMLQRWQRLVLERTNRRLRPLNHPELLGTSPRTAKQGAQVLLDLTSPTATDEALMACAVADPSERFLHPLALSRPDLPYSVRMMATLAGTDGILPR